MFAMAKLMKMKTTEQNKVVLYLCNSINFRKKHNVYGIAHSTIDKLCNLYYNRYVYIFYMSLK